MGSQWSEAKMGEICSYSRVPVKRRAAAFCTIWRRQSHMHEIRIMQTYEVHVCLSVTYFPTPHRLYLLFICFLLHVSSPSSPRMFPPPPLFGSLCLLCPFQHCSVNCKIDALLQIKLNHPLCFFTRPFSSHIDDAQSKNIVWNRDFGKWKSMIRPWFEVNCVDC